MKIDEPVYVCINSSEEMNRGEQAIAGQLWIQGDRQMSASNTVPEGMADTTDSALLAGVAEAVSWNHASQPDEGRKGQRVVIYPKELTQLEDFLSTCDPNVDPEDGHPLAYETILQSSAKYEATPQFLREDSTPIVSDPTLAEAVPVWMTKARQIATGSRKRVLEDGRDVENSDDEDDESMKPDELTGMYTAEMDPKQGPKVLTTAEANRLRAAGRALKSFTTASQLPPAPQDPTMAVFSGSIFPLVPFSPEPERKPTPLGTPVNSDEEDMSYDQKRAAKLGKKMAGKSIPRSSSSPGFDAPPRKSVEPTVQAPAKGAPLEITKVTAVPAVGISKQRTKAVASQAPADQPKEAKASTRTKGQAMGQVDHQPMVSPGTKVPLPMVDHPPMVTRARKKASGAGGLRGVDGLGQTEIGVDHKGPPSKT
jgi:hypothetical protein